MTYKNGSITVALLAVLTITLGFNSAYAQESTQPVENKVQEVLDVKNRVEIIIEKIERVENKLEKAESNNAPEKRIADLENRLDKLNNKYDKQMQKFIKLTTMSDGNIDSKLLEQASQVESISSEFSTESSPGFAIRAASNYQTEFWNSPQCSHVATFPNPCFGTDFASTEFSWTAPTNPLSVKTCSFGPCIPNIVWSLNAPYTWTYTPVDLYFDKKKSYGYDLVTGQKTNTVTLYSPDSTHVWLKTPVNHNAVTWTTYFYENGSNSKTIWVSSVTQLGFNAN